MEKKIIVFGATGKSGVEICKELAKSNMPYTAFVRDPSTFSLPQENVTLCKGDVLKVEDVSGAAGEGSYTDVIISLGSREIRKTTIRSAGTKNIIDALKRANAESHLHIVSALGVGDSRKQLTAGGRLITKLLLKSVMEDHQVQEDAVIQSGLPYHIIRPVGLTDGAATGHIHVQAERALPSNKVDRADVAKFLVHSLIEGKKGFSSVCRKS